MKNDLAQEILLNRTKRVSLFRDLPPNSRGFVLLGLPNAIQRELMKKLNNKEIVQLGDYLDPDEVTDLLQRIPKKRRRRLLKKLGRDIKKKVEFLLKFDSRTAAGLMSLDYIEIRKNKTFEDLSKIIRKHEKRTGKIPTILVVEEGFLVGELPFYTLAISKRNEKINKYIAKVPSVKYDMDENGVISLFKKNPHNKIIVLDSDYSILGVIYSDDILKFIENQSANNLRDFAGISDEEDVLDSAFIKVKNRYKWLIVNLGTAFFAAMIVSLFKETISYNSDKKKIMRKLILFYLVSSVSLIARMILFNFLLVNFGMGYQLNTLIGIGLAILLNFFGYDKLVFEKKVKKTE